MASVRALALRRAQVEARLTAHAERLAGDSPRPVWSKVPEIATIERLEWAADLLDAAAGSPATATNAAEHQQLEVTTEIAADLFDQVQEAQNDAPQARRPAPAHQPAAPAGPAQTDAPGPAAPKGRRQ